MSQPTLRPRFDPGLVEDIDATELIQWAYQLISQVPEEDAPEKKEVLKKLCKVDLDIARANKAGADYKQLLRKKMGEGDDVKPDIVESGSANNEEDENALDLRSIKVPITDRFDEFRQDFVTCISKYNKNDVDVVLRNVNIEENRATNNGDDDDIEPDDVIVKISRIDPISQKKIEIAVKNPNCPHVYDQKIMEEFLRKKPNGTKCPVAGCSSKKTFKFKDLQPYTFDDDE